MQLMRMQFKRFFKNRLLVIIISLFTVVVTVLMAFPVSMGADGNPLVLLGQSLLGNYYLAVVFMYVSFEFLIKAKADNAYEYLGAVKNGVSLFYGSGIAVMSVILAVFCLFVFIVNAVFYISFFDVYLNYITHIALNIFLNMFIIPLVFILFGAVFTLTRKRVTGYALMTLVCLLTSPVFLIIGTQVHSNMNLNIFGFVELFDFSAPLVSWTPIYTFGFSVLPYRFFQACFFLFLFGAIIVFAVCKKRGIFSKLVPAICVTVSAAMLIMYFQPVSAVTLSDNPFNGFAADQYYYSLSSVSIKEEPADFEISKYKINLSVHANLKATAEISISEATSGVFKFTLYHGYSVSGVTDGENNPLSYDRDSDYITVNCDKIPEKIIISYSGSGNRNYSNSQGISLPGYFPFYPQKGFKALYNDQELGFNKFSSDGDCRFDVTVDYGKEVYCNLPATGYNTYSGTSDSLTLVSGFYQECKINGIEVVYPYLLFNKSYTKEMMLDDVSGFFEKCLSGKNINRIIVLANVNNTSNYERMTVYGDYVTVIGLSNLEYCYEQQRISNAQRSIENYLELYQNVKPAYNQALDSAKKTPDSQESKIVLLFDEKLNALGEDKFVKAAEEYINSDTDQGAAEFLQGLGES